MFTGIMGIDRYLSKVITYVSYLASVSQIPREWSYNADPPRKVGPPNKNYVLFTRLKNKNPKS